jgi:uncharacterized membrane protein YfcA
VVFVVAVRVVEVVCVPPAPVEVRVVVVVVCVVVVVWLPPVVGPCAAPPAPDAPWAPPAAPPAGFAAGALAGAAGLAGALGGVVAPAKLAMPTKAERIAAAEPFRMALQSFCVVIMSSFLFEARAAFLLREHFTQRC